MFDLREKIRIEDVEAVANRFGDYKIKIEELRLAIEADKEILYPPSFVTYDSEEIYECLIEELACCEEMVDMIKGMCDSSVQVYKDVGVDDNRITPFRD